MKSIGIDVFSSLIQNLARIRVWVRIANFHINPLSQAEFSMDTNRQENFSVRFKKLLVLE